MLQNKTAQFIKTPLCLALMSLNFQAVAASEDKLALANKVEITAERLSDTKPVQGYQAKKSVSATKTETPLSDVPQSVTVVTQEQMRDSAVQSIADAVRYVPGLTASQGEGNRDAINFRGNGVTTGDFYLDGVRDDIQTYRDLYNIDRLEVLKGPNGMIFGRGAAGGAINRVSKEAGWDAVRELQLSYAGYNQKRASIDVGQGLSDSVAFRLNAVDEQSDSYRHGVSLHRYGVNPTFTFAPDEKTKITLGVEYFNDKRTGDRGIPSIGDGTNNRPYRISDYAKFYGSADLSHNQTETYAGNALIEHAFSDAFTLRNRTRYADYDKYYQNVYAAGSVNNERVALGAYYDATQRQNFINQTDAIFKFNTVGIQHEFLAGVEIVKQNTDAQHLLTSLNVKNDKYSDNLYVSNSALTVDVNHPTLTGGLNFNIPNRKIQSDVSVLGVYLQDQIKLNDYVTTVLGIRQDRFNNDFERTDWKTTNPVGEEFQSDKTQFLTSPRAGLIIKPSANVSLYGAYSLSYVPRSGDQLVSLASGLDSLKPEKFTNHELGIKVDITPEFNLTLATYLLKRQNVLADSNKPSEAILLDGQQTRGIELGVAGKATERWSVFGGYAYQDAEILSQQITSSGKVLKGSDVSQTPKHSFSLWNRYDFNPEWGVGLGVIARSSMYASTPTETASTLLAGYARVDAAVFWQPEKNTQVRLNIENLTNRDYAISAHNNNNIMPGSPINARLSLIYQF
jgi:catecholate siderophore receptor